MQLPFIFAYFLRDLRKNKMPPGNLHHLQMAYNEQLKSHRKQHSNIFSMGIFWAILASHKALWTTKNPAYKCQRSHCALTGCTIHPKQNPFQALLNTVAIVAKRPYLLFCVIAYHVSLVLLCFTCFPFWDFLLPCLPGISLVRPLQSRVLRFSVAHSIGRF